jgi:hypothetical protein
VLPLVFVLSVGITNRNKTLEAVCSSALDAQYGRPAAAVIRSRLMEHPSRLAINKLWESTVDGECEAYDNTWQGCCMEAQHWDQHMQLSPELSAASM